MEAASGQTRPSPVRGQKVAWVGRRRWNRSARADKSAEKTFFRFGTLFWSKNLWQMTVPRCMDVPSERNTQLLSVPF